ncbi:2Fe-2S iron-sulfur cluster-binding protein [Variovorax rhizosphaerae]|uniref:2Fe-2S iron-sulfur cluster-binding protein n=1 Tax=Variovorax rhizosphaerae TaxID=1836200 RepID=A0ABU8WM43_9BURK
MDLSQRVLGFIPRSRRDLRLASGLVLFTYVATHLCCHALGLVSLDTAEEALRNTVRFWHSLPGTVLLYAAAAIHVSLALFAVYERRTFRMPPVQGIRIILGLVMPIGLIAHFVVTRYAHDRFGLSAEYARVAGGLWAGGASGLALGLLAPGWIHGCLGLRFAFGHRVTSQRVKLALFGAALLLPVLAALGFINMGRELYAPSSGHVVPPPYGDAAQEAQLDRSGGDARWTYLSLLLLILVGRMARSLNERRRKSVVWISYPSRTVSVPRGWSVLEASRSFGIPHQALCGGRARCTTCRVRVVEGASHCPDAKVDEARALHRLAGAKGTIRLACQLRPTGNVEVVPILSGARAGRPPVSQPSSDAAELEAILLLLDVRLDTASVAPSAAAHDAIYALSHFQSIAEAAAGSRAEVFRHAASSWILLFRCGSDPAAVSANALSVARQIDADAASLCQELARDLGLHASASLAMHAGRVVVGTLGAATMAIVGGPVEDLERIRGRRSVASGSLLVSGSAASAASISREGLAWHPGPLGEGEPTRGEAWAEVRLTDQ